MSGDDLRSGPECGRYAEEIAELALGISTGRQRARALAHVEACPRCHAEMEQLSLAADSLLEVVPGIEPPLGFEVRLMERLGPGRAPRHSVHRRWIAWRSSLALASVAMLVALGAGVGAGWLVRGGPQPSRSSFGTAPGGRAETASLMAAGRSIGNVTVYSGRSTWLFMSLDDGSWSGEASCEVRLAGGRTILLGTFWLDNGYGAWGVTLAPGTGRVRTASVLSGGSVLASADFAPGTTAYVSGAAARVDLPGHQAPARGSSCQPVSSSSTVSGSSRRTPASIASTTSRGNWSSSCSSS
ncbi:MAG: hypothetical protein ACLPUG_18250 [Acidimicrobiales bacterium]